MAENGEKNTFYLKVIAADRVFFQGRCLSVVLPAVDGEHAILAHHSDMMIATSTGTIRFRTESGEVHEAVVGRLYAGDQQPCDHPCGICRAAGRNRRAACQRGDGARAGTASPEAEPAGILSHPGVAGKSDGASADDEQEQY